MSSPYREKTVANMYAFEGEYAFSESLFCVQCQCQGRQGTIDQMDWSYPLSIVVADKCIRTGPWHPALAIEILQRGDPTVVLRLGRDIHPTWVMSTSV
jgi:hypothetical protein